MYIPFSPDKRLGQHFLTDTQLAERIVRAIGAPSDARVVEIGAGCGALSLPLQCRYPELIALEIDHRAVAFLKECAPDLNVIHCDVLKVDWAAMAKAAGGCLYVAGNLPYHITSPILFGLLAHRAYLTRAVLMMQREVADRLVARPGTKTYGGPSVTTQLLANPRVLFKVSPAAFWPRPSVDSAVVALDFNTRPEMEVDTDMLQRVVRTAFNQRRKMLRNSLGALASEYQLKIPGRWARSRPEELEPAGFVDIVQYFQGASVE